MVRPVAETGAGHMTQADSVRAPKPVGTCGRGSVVRKEPSATESAPLATPRWSVAVEARPPGDVAM